MNRQGARKDEPVALCFPAALYLATLALAALFAIRTPLWLAPDEPAHYAYVEHVALTGLPPVLVASCYDEGYKSELTATNFAGGVDLDRFCYEGHQPPLFYYLAAPVYFISGGSLLALRLFCAVLGAGIPVVAWAITRQMGGSESLALATGALVATVPQHLAMIGSLNNDALTYLTVALSVWQMVRLLRDETGARSREWLKLGLLAGLALVTKTLAWVVLPLAALLLLLRVRSGRSWLIRRGALVAAVAALFIVPWFGRNALTYEPTDILALERHDEIALHQPRTDAEIEQRGLSGTIANGLRTTFNSFWGQFGWMKAPLREGEYQVLALFSLLAVIGLAGWLLRSNWRASALDGRALLIMAAWVLLSASLVLYYNLEFVQYQGRYLFPALTPIAFFLMGGLGAWLPGRLRPLLWGALLLFLLYLDLLAILERLPGMLTY